MEVLESLFESELIAEITSFPLQKTEKGTVVIKENCKVPEIPILIRGRIRVSQTTDGKNQTKVYDILPIESCILSLVAAQKNKPSLGNGIVEVESDIIFVPGVKTLEWYEKYTSWRSFVSGLYNKRLGELIEQRNQIQGQAKRIADQKNEITESIRYARQIQKVILQSPASFKSYVPNSFILNRPKDIVSGDFYWSFDTPDRVLFAVADCTGHGVPGAMLSIICYKKLNEVVSNNSRMAVGEILDEMAIKIEELFETKEITLSDGMDISLCAIDKKTGQFTFSGANNSIYLADSEHGIINELKANRQPIGKADCRIPFQTQIINYKKDSFFYLMTDGFMDQFGGDKGKKLRKSGLKTILSKASSKEITNKKTFLNSALEEWKGAGEQVDDILLVGLKL
mgnify:FL=1